MNLDHLMMHNLLTSVEMMKLLGLDPDYRGAIGRHLTISWLYLILNFSFAVEVARYRDPTRYSMIMELDHSPITEYFAIRVSFNFMFYHNYGSYIHVATYGKLQHIDLKKL